MHSSGWELVLFKGYIIELKFLLCIFDLAIEEMASLFFSMYLLYYSIVLFMF